MRIAFVIRSNLFEVPGGDTIQVLETARHLRELGTEVDICLTNLPIAYSDYHIFHFFNIPRPSDILFHLSKIRKPFALSPILIDYSEYDRHHRKGLSGFVFRQFSASANEYIKTFSRWIRGNNSLQSKKYIWKGQQRSIKEILRKAAILLPNSEAEYKKLSRDYQVDKPYLVVPNGIDPSLFRNHSKEKKNNRLVICAARIEGLKNQLNLIKALNNTDFTLMIIGAPAPNQRAYYENCRKIAASNIIFHDPLPQAQLVKYYGEAKVHALPSWFETCGLSSLEAAAMGCNLVISDKGYTREYFGEDAFYADPDNIESIYKAVETASKAEFRQGLQQKILEKYTWKQAANVTAEAYKKIIAN